MQDVRGADCRRGGALRAGRPWRSCGAAMRPACPGWLQCPPVRHGVGQRGAAKRQGPRPAGPIGPEALAHHRVTLEVRAWAVWCNGVIRALAQAGLCRPKGRGWWRPERATTAPDEGGGPVTRQRQRTDTQGPGRTLAVTVYGWQVLVLIEARPKMPRAVTVGQLQAPAGLSRRARVTQARAKRAGDARQHQGGFERGWWAGTERWGLDPPGPAAGYRPQRPWPSPRTPGAWPPPATASPSAAGCPPSASDRARRPGRNGWRRRSSAWPAGRATLRRNARAGRPPPAP